MGFRVFEKIYVESDKAEEENYKDEREPYLLIAVREDGNGVILETHSEGLAWLRDGIDNEDFLEAYCDNVPVKLGLYEWRGKIEGSRSFENEYDYRLNGEWTTLWKRDD